MGSSGPKEQDLEQPTEERAKKKADGYYDLVGQAGPDTLDRRPKFELPLTNKTRRYTTVPARSVCSSSSSVVQVSAPGVESSRL